MSRWKIVGMALLVLSTSAWAQSPVPGSPLPPPSSAVPSNGANVDPTKNVLDLVGALKEMLKEVRSSDKDLFDARLNAAQRYTDRQAKQDQELRESSIARIDSENRLRSDFTERLLVAEAKRIDAIRAVDVNAVAVANQRTSEQATALQTQTTASAEVLRNQVARSAEDLRALVQTTATTQLANQTQQFNAVIAQIGTVSARVTTLEQSGAEGKGRQIVQDPAQAAAINRLEAAVTMLVAARADVTGTKTGQNEALGWVMGLIVLVSIGLAGFGAVVAMRRPNPPQPVAGAIS